MYRSYDDMYSFHDPEEGAEFVAERLKSINAIIDSIANVESVDEIDDLVAELRSAAEKISGLYDDQLEEADKIMQSGPDPDYAWDNRDF